MSTSRVPIGRLWSQPTGHKRWCDVESALITLIRHRSNVVFTMGNKPRGHATLLRRWIYVNDDLRQWRCFNVATTSCVQWKINPEDTRRCCDVESMSMTLIQSRNNIVWTMEIKHRGHMLLLRRLINVNDVHSTSQQRRLPIEKQTPRTHDVVATLNQRQRRWLNVVTTSWVQWEAPSYECIPRWHWLPRGSRSSGSEGVGVTLVGMVRGWMHPRGWG